MINYNFEWDPEKAKTGFKQHGVSYEEATTVFRDPTAVSIFDDKPVKRKNVGSQLAYLMLDD